MNFCRNKITRDTVELQTQSAIPLWSIASEEMVYSMSRTMAPAWGKNCKRAHQLIYLGMKTKSSDLVLFMIGLVKIFSIWKNIKNTTPSQPLQFKTILAGFGASPEEHLLSEFKKKCGESLLYVNWVNYSGVEQLGSPSLFKIITMLAKNAFGHTARFKNASRTIQSYQRDFLTVCAKNIGLYSFFLVYWKMAQSKGIHTAYFLAPDMPAFACTATKIKTIFLQHGLLALGIVMPQFQEINVLTHIEKKYLKKLLPTINVKKITYPVQLGENKNNTIIILFPNSCTDKMLHQMKSFIMWAKNMRIKIVIRPTNKIMANEIVLLNNQFHDFVLDDFKESMQNSLETWQPKFIAAWTSTALALSLEHGFLPISFCDPCFEHLKRMIYPLGECVIFWPRDKECIEKAFVSPDFYATEVARLQNKNQVL